MIYRRSCFTAAWDYGCFAENASDESERLKESGIRIESADMGKEELVKAVSAKRYIEQQKEKEKNTFIVVVSKDGYVNCFSTNESK